jgi:hypothetical protein
MVKVLRREDKYSQVNYPVHRAGTGSLVPPGSNIVALPHKRVCKTVLFE